MNIFREVLALCWVYCSVAGAVADAGSSGEEAQGSPLKRRPHAALASRAGSASRTEPLIVPQMENLGESTPSVLSEAPKPPRKRAAGKEADASSLTMEENPFPRRRISRSLPTAPTKVLFKYFSMFFLRNCSQ